ncbi:MAG TPA: hypothetical protein VK175_05930 [Leadbetterella sp.]|nr:hypothetical protein [Leadbetterella sp.]
MPIKHLILTLFFTFTNFSCKDTTRSERVVVVQPFEDFSPKMTSVVYEKLKTIHKTVILKSSIKLPESAYYKPRNRFKAQKILDYFSKKAHSDTVTIGLTNRDISITKANNQDSGIMGLGFCPGSSCVVSTFRLRKKNLKEQFIKLSLHELGHTQGLPHCENLTCYMRDAKGKNVFDEETDFCLKCKSFLKKKGWRYFEK